MTFASKPAKLAVFTFVLLGLLSLAGCQGQGVSQTVPEVLESYPHDTAAFTQGLLLAGEHFYESTGIYGQSTLREVIPETGEVLREVEVPDEYFAEGLTLVGDRLIQITWKEGTAFVYNLDTFEQEDTLAYDGEGWGLCFDGKDIVMSDGSATLTRRDPETFAALGTTEVTLSGKPVTMLNELECVDGFVYANIWQSDTIVKIGASGQVVEEIDAANLLPEAVQAQLVPDAVLNGIAYDPEAETFFLTGKLWPTLLEVRLK